MSYELTIYEKFDLSEEEAAEVFLFLVKCAKKELDEKATIREASKSLNTKQTVFASFMMGYLSGLYTSECILKNYGIKLPELKARASIFAQLYNDIDNMGEDELKKRLIAKFKAIKEKKFRENAEFA